MRKMGLLLGALIVSFNCHASSDALSANLKSSILKNTTEQTNSGDNPSIIYGGQDISRPVIAAAHESLWAGSSDFTG